MYLLLKHLHVGCVTLSAAGFLLRGIWMLQGSPLLRRRLTKVLPHLVDTLLLGSAIALAWISGQYPPHAPWVGAKIAGLVAYVVLGTLALKRGRTLAQRGTAFVAALLCLAWIVSVALSRDPAGYLRPLLAG